MPQGNRKRAGITLAIVLVVLSVMLVLIYSVATSATSCLTLASREGASERARYVAESGLNDAVSRIRTLIATSPGSTFTGINPSVAMPNVDGSYVVTAVDNHQSSSPTPCPPIGYLPGMSWYVEATGTSGNAVQRASVIMGLVENHYYKYSVFAKSSIVMNGQSLFASYDSRIPADSPQPTASAEVGTNGSITMVGGATIQGDAGAAGTVTGGTVTGDRENGVAPVAFKVLDCTYQTPNSNDTLVGSGYYDAVKRTLIMNGGTLVLGNDSGVPASYYLTDLMISAQATLRVVGPVRIYTTGDVTLGGDASLVNDTNAAGMCRIYNSGPNIAKVHGGPQAYFCYYGPQSDVEILGNSNIFGAIVGGTVKITGSAAVVNDLALREDSSEGALIQLAFIAWDRH